MTPFSICAHLCDAVVGPWGGIELRRDIEFAFTWASPPSDS